MGNLGVYDAWVPRDYLGEYYRELQDDERNTMRYFVEQIAKAPPGPILCFGCGPTLHHMFLAAPRATEIILADYIPENLAEIERWRRQDAGAHDWTPFVRYTLQCESGREPTEGEIDDRMSLLRGKITALVHADASLADPLGPAYRGRFAGVLSPYCAEATTSDKATWIRHCRNIATLVRPGGLFLTSAVRRCHQYKAGTRYFPTTYIDEADLRAVLLQDFRPDSVMAEAREVPEHQAHGFSGIVLARGLKDGG